MGLAEQMRKHRIESQLSMRQLAGVIGVTCGYISQIENYRSIPSPDILVKLVIFFDMDINEVIKWAVKEKVEIYEDRVLWRYERAKKRNEIQTANS